MAYNSRSRRLFVCVFFHIYLCKLKNHNSPKKKKSIMDTSCASADSNSLPIIPAIKVTNKCFVAGHPSQIVDLLTSGVATAIVRSKANSNNPMFELLLRCPLLAPNSNLPVYFCLDHLNQPLKLEAGIVVLQLPNAEDSDKVLRNSIDEERAQHWSDSMALAINFWEIKMEELVVSMYPNRVPKQVDQYASSSRIEMKVWNSLTDVPALLALCTKRNGFPSFKLAYTWIGSKEDPRSKEHMWGMKFDFSSYGTFPPVPRVRRVLTAAEKHEQLLKKRKPSTDAEVVIEEVVSVKEE